ncbi:MAG: shikimate dehydrogenase [Inquilinaceae bacterium]
MELRPPEGPALCFVGVSTAGSFINSLFPVWATVLGLGDVRLHGIDLPLEVSPDTVRRTVRFLERTETVHGALVTTHKIAVHRHASTLFSTLDRYAVALGEISSISKPGGGLAGHAKDPITAGLALDRIVDRDHWQARPAAAALLMGCGGASLALAAHLLERSPAARPASIVLTDRDPGRVAHARERLDAFGNNGAASVRIVAGPDDHDTIIAGLPAGSLVVNGTGLGKDRPGSPVGNDARFPKNGAAWDFNYRGDLEFLRQARASQAERTLTVADGWVYFLYGWSYVIAEVFGIDLDAALTAQLEAAAERVRDSASTGT